MADEASSGDGLVCAEEFLLVATGPFGTTFPLCFLQA